MVHTLPSSLQAAASLDDATLAAQAPALRAREAAARSAFAAALASPVPSAFLRLEAPPIRRLRAIAAATPPNFGRLLVAPIMAPHVHTPHCEPACPLRFAAHEHSAACCHAPQAEGNVWLAAKRGDLTALEAALTAGESTEEADYVSSDGGRRCDACSLAGCGSLLWRPPMTPQSGRTALLVAASSTLRGSSPRRGQT